MSKYYFSKINSISNNSSNKNKTSLITNNFNQNKYSFSESSPIFDFCNNISEINNQNENGYTPVYLSILSNNIIALKKLISLGADINIPNNLNETPLFLSVKNSNFEAFIILLKSNSDCNIQNIKGDTPLHIAVSKKEKKFIEMLLINNSNPNIQNFTDGQTPTHLIIINKLDEEILKLFKKYKGNIFHIKDKLNKTPFDYVNEINDEKYKNLVIKIFGYNHSTNNNGLNEINNDLLDINNYEGNFILNKPIFKVNSYPEKGIKEITHTHTNTNSNINADYYIITSETMKNEFKLDNCESNKDKIISNKSFKVNKGILSSEVSSENVQIKELNSSIDNNTYKIKKSLTEFLPEEKFDKINIKDHLDINNNVLSEIYNPNGEINNLQKTKSHQLFNRNTDNTKTKSNLRFSHSNSSHNSNRSNSENNSYSNIYMTNSVGANKKIVKNIIRDTIKKIIVKSISISDDNNTSNANILSKESEKVLSLNSNNEDTKSKANNTLKDKNVINSLKNTENINNEIKSNTNLYENGTSSYYLLQNKNNNDNNITLSKLIPQETKTINLYEETNNNNIDKENNEIKEENDIENQKDKFLENSNSNIFSDLQLKSNNNEGLSNNDISLSYSKNLQNDEDDIQFKLLENKLDKKLQEIKNENNIELNIDNSNLDIKIYDNHSNFDSKNNEITNIDNIDNKKSFNIINSKNNITGFNNNEIHNKKISNGNIIHSNKRTKLRIDSYTINQPLLYYKHKTLNNSFVTNYIDKSEDINGVKNNLKKKIFKKNRFNKSQIYLNRRKQLSHHLNINNKKENEENEKFIDDILMSKISNTINANDKENYNPNKISIKNQQIYKNKNNIVNPWYNINSNKSFKSTFKSKNSNKYLKTNRGSKISLTKSGSCQNMNPPPIGGFPNKDIYISPSNNSVSSRYNLITNNSNINNSNSNQNKSNNIINNKLSVNNTLGNNSSFSTSKPKHSSLNKKGNNNAKNIPLNNNEKIIINPYRKNYGQKYNNINNININYDSDESNNNNINNRLKNISTEELIKLRDFLISCDLLCYYNLFIDKNIYHIDSYIKDIQNKIPPFNYESFEEIGIKKPGHIYRILIKLELDAGIIDIDLFNYINDKINFNSVTNTLALTSSVNGGFCCGINLCPKENYYKQKIRNGAIYYNDLSSFLRANDLNRLKGNFIHNGFDKIEFILIQQFSKYAFDKKILNEYLHIYIDSDKNKLLNILYIVKNNIMREFELNFGKKELYQNSIPNKNSYKVYEFSSPKNNKSDDNINDNNIKDMNLDYNNNENKSNKFCNIF